MKSKLFEKFKPRKHLDDRAKKCIAYTVGIVSAVILGTIPGFLIVFHKQLANGGTLTQQIMIFVYVIIAYGMLGLLFGAALPKYRWKWGIPLAIGTFLFVVMYTIKEPECVMQNTLYLILAFSAAALGGCAGYIMRHLK